MKSHARVVVIGGGIVGASTCYHLAQHGVTDVALLELDELTSGSTWHAAGNVPTFSTSRNIIKLQRYSTELFSRLAEEVDYPINYHMTGSVRLAQSRARMEEYEHVCAMARVMGLDYELLDLTELKNRYPYIETHGLVGALWDPYDGDIDPSQVTQALAKGARDAGAEINRNTRVTGITRLGNGAWRVHTSKGEIDCEVVVNAGGYRGAEVAALVGDFLPVVSMEHQYLVTETITELAGGGEILPLLRDPDDSYYLRQERDGLLLGPYEWGATPHWPDGKLPEDFASQLYADDLDRLETYIENACARVPLLGSVGVTRVVNGPIPYSPDGYPYIGPANGLDNFFHCCSFSFGICQGGGAGKSIAEWIVDGQPEWDLWSLDPRRYGDYATQNYVVEKAVELYQREYAIAFPHEERPAGRPAKCTPVYQRLKDKGAMFGARGGWERATWFPRSPADAREELSFHHNHWHDTVAEECRGVRERVGILDLSGFTKYEVRGADAADWLNGLIAGNLPRIGRITLAYFCTPAGGVWSEMTISRVAEDRFSLISAAAAERHDWQWLHQHLPSAADITLENTTARTGCLVLAGPRSRELLSRVTNADLSNAAFPWLSTREIQIGYASMRALRVNYVGELGWELHVPVEHQLAIYDRLWSAGDDLGLVDFGAYAMESLRLEKCYRAWKVELDHEYSPLRSGLDRFVNLDKPEFIGRDAILAERERGLPDVFAAFLLDQGTADAMYGCPIFLGDEYVGYVTSGGYGHTLGRSIALGYIRPDLARSGTRVRITVLGEPREAEWVAEPIFDPRNERPRA